MQGKKISLPSSGFSRLGANQKSWNISGIDYKMGGQYSAVSSTVAYATWDLSSCVQLVYFPIHHKYDQDGQMIMRMTNNLTSIGFRGDGSDGIKKDGSNGIEQQLIGCRINDGVQELQSSCFYGCEKLQYIDLPESCKTIGDYAFYNCKNLKRINCLETSGNVLYYIGQHAFDGCESLTSITVSLSGTNRATGIGSYAFANCIGLKDVYWTRSSFLAYHMFDNCTSLTGIHVNNYTSYVYPEALANIPNLLSINIPSNIWQMSDGLFMNDSRLSSVSIEDDNQNSSFMQQVGDCVFSGCDSLTSLTLPRSINSLNCIADNFLSGSNIRSVRFNGLSDNVFYTGSNVSVDYGNYSTGVFYKHLTDAKNIWSIANKYNVPIVMIRTNHVVDDKQSPDYGYTQKGNYMTPGTCSHCKSWYNNIECSSKFRNFMLSCGYFMIVGGRGPFGDITGDYKGTWGKKTFTVNTTYRIYDANRVSELETNHGMASSGTYPVILVYWKKSDGTVVKSTESSFCAPQTVGKIDTAINYIKNVLKDYTGPENIVKDFSTNTIIGTFGSSQEELIYIASSGEKYTCTTQTITQQVNVKVDSDTLSGFQYGTWYYNAKELREYADEYNIPVLVEYSDVGCTPCQYFKKNVFNNTTFQNWVKKSNYLFCRVEVESQSWWSDYVNHPESYYVDNIWSKKSPNYTNQGIPIFMWYWKKSDDTDPSVWEISSYHYNPDAVGAKPPFTMQELMDITDNRFRDYESDDRFVRFDEIENLMNITNDKIVGRKYPNQENDQNGKYFVCNTDKVYTQQYTTTFSIYGCPQMNSLEVGQTVSIPPATYQYYDPDKSQEYHIDSYGVIFKVNSLSVVEYMYIFQNKYDEDTDNDSDEKYNLGNWYELYQDDLSSIFTDMWQTAEDKSYTLIVNYLLSGEEKSDEFYNNIMCNADFKNWTANTFVNGDSAAHYLLVNVISSQNGTGGAPQSFMDFVNDPMRMCVLRSYPDGSYPSQFNKVPSTYVYHACWNCYSGNPDLSDVIDPEWSIDLTDSTGDLIGLEDYEDILINSASGSSKYM